MDPVQAALYAVAVPAAVAAGVLFALHVFTRKRAEETGVALAIATGFVVSFVGIAGVPAFPPRESWQWLAFVAVAAAAIGTFEPRVPELARRGLRIALLVFAVLAVAPHTERGSLVSGTVCLAALISTWCLESLAKTRGPRAALAPAIVAASAAAIALALFAGWARGGVLAGALAASASACFVLGWWIPTNARDASLPAAALIATVSVCGSHWADLPVASAVLLAIAPAGGALAVGLLARRGGPMRLVLRAAGGAAIPAGIAVALAARAP